MYLRTLIGRCVAVLCMVAAPMGASADDTGAASSPAISSSATSSPMQQLSISPDLAPPGAARALASPDVARALGSPDVARALLASPEGMRAAQSELKSTLANKQPTPDNPSDQQDLDKEKASRDAVVAPPTEFQKFVAQSTGTILPIFGANLFVGAPSTFAPVDRVPVTADYVIGPGDEIKLRVWGKVDMDLALQVDRNGSVFIPEVGNVSVAGVAYKNLNEHLTKVIGRVLRNFELNASLGQLRSIQIFVVGQARRPGSYTISSLSTLVNALFVSGGPSSLGSMRRIQVKRGSRIVTTFDLYDLIIKGDKSRDVPLLPGDVIYIPPAGRQVAISGSVNVSAIFEIKDKSTFADLLDLAGGLNNVAATQKATVEGILDRKLRKVDEITFDAAGLARELHDGDLVKVTSVSPRFDNAVKLQGNVASPMRYIWRKGMRITDLLGEKNALIPSAYWGRQNAGALIGRFTKKEVNWDYAVMQRLDESNLTTRLVAFNLGKAIKGDPVENMLLQPGDIVTIFSADEELPKTENDVALNGSVFGASKRRFVWREGMKINDLIPNAKWLVDYYDYWSNLKGDKLSTGLNWGYANIVRLQPRDLTRTMLAFDLGKAVLENDSANNLALLPGDEVAIFTNNEIQTPISTKSAYVRLEGEFKHPGIYKVDPGETLRQLVVKAGGLDRHAYVYGAQLIRESTRALQQTQMDEMINRMERDVEQAASNKLSHSGSDADTMSIKSEVESQKALISKLRSTKAVGRIVLETDAEQEGVKALPDDVALEDGDQIIVPPKPSIVSVFGAVYNQSSYLYKPEKRVSDYLAQAGGPTRNADESNIFILKSNGAVTSKNQAGWLGGFNGDRLMPGDTVVVPEDFNKVNWMRELKDWSQVIYQFALGAAAIKTIRQ